MPTTDTTLKAFVRRCMDGMPGVDDDMLASELRAMIEREREAEREACAKIAEDMAEGVHPAKSYRALHHAAAAIRARKGDDSSTDAKYYRGVIGTDPPICTIESHTIGPVIATTESTSSKDGPKVEWLQVDDSSTPNDGPEVASV